MTRAPATAASLLTSCRLKASILAPASSKPICGRRSPTTWSHRSSPYSRRCRSPPMGRSIGVPCPAPSRCGRRRDGAVPRPPLSTFWSRCGVKCSTGLTSAWRTTSSTSGDTRFWLCVCSTRSNAHAVSACQWPPCSQGPPSDDLVEVIQQQAGMGVRHTMTPIQASGSRLPFFFVYGDWAGGGFYCRELARHVGPEQPFYVFHPGASTAARFRQRSRQWRKSTCEPSGLVRPSGPYLLGGYCNGGLVALEMAQRLQAQGEQVSFLLAIDAMAWNVRLHALQQITRRLARLCRLSSAGAQRLFLKLHGAVVTVARLWYMWRKSPRDVFRRAYRRLRGKRADPRTTERTGSPLSPRGLELRADTISGRITIFVTEEIAGDRASNGTGVKWRRCRRVWDAR